MAKPNKLHTHYANNGGIVQMFSYLSVKDGVEDYYTVRPGWGWMDWK